VIRIEAPLLFSLIGYLMDEDEPFEESIIFVDCTCEHEPEQHGWGSL